MFSKAISREDTGELLKQWAVDEARAQSCDLSGEGWRVQVPTLPQQEPGKDACGAYTMMYAFFTAMGLPLPCLQPGVSDLRLRQAIAHMIRTERVM